MRVALTGASGSLGTALLAKLAESGADRIVGFSRNEHLRAQMQARYVDHPAVKIYAGDIRDELRLRDIFAGCEAVIHAAARKVVSGHFDEAREMNLTNVQGTINVLSAARHAGVGKVLLISSDKSVEPINVYGASKMMAEAHVISENARSFASGTRSSVIRYGNVLASNGSVVRVWRERAAASLPLPISDQQMTRFWWTIEDAAEAALLALGWMRGGEVLLPIMKAAPLTRLLEAIAPDAETYEIGIRPGGEKLHEKLLDEDEVRRAIRRSGWIIVPPPDSSELWDRSPWLGDPVPAGFEYRSDTWSEQWSVEELRGLLER